MEAAEHSRVQAAAVEVQPEWVVVKWWVAVDGYEKILNEMNVESRKNWKPLFWFHLWRGRVKYAREAFDS